MDNVLSGYLVSVKISHVVITIMAELAICERWINPSTITFEKECVTRYKLVYIVIVSVVCSLCTVL